MSNYKTDIHYRPSDKTGNVKCLNGFAHLKWSFNIKDVNCAKCLDTTDKDQELYWTSFFNKNSKRL